MSTAVPNHRRTKPGGIKPGAVTSGVTGPTSQIPGLSQSADESAPAERTSGRRVGIFETDSDYVKLAKGGGHKGLLSHDVDDDDDKPKRAYTPANWFADDGTKSGNKATSPESQMKAGRQPLAAPFGTDNSSSWEKETDRFSHGKDKMSPDSPSGQMEGLSLTNKYKRTSYDKKAPPVSMSKLLSHGYVEDKKKSPNDDDTSMTLCAYCLRTLVVVAQWMGVGPVAPGSQVQALGSAGLTEVTLEQGTEPPTAPRAPQRGCPLLRVFVHGVTSEQTSTIATEDVDDLE